MASTPDNFERPILTVDTVIFTLLNNALHVLLVKRNREPAKGAWTLPGGFIHPEEDKDAEDAARRVLASKAGVKVSHLEQLYTFSGKARDKRGWSASIVYLALVRAEGVGKMSDDAKWVPVDRCPRLPFDHSKILAAGLHRVRDKSSYSSLPGLLLPKVFTLPQLQRVYEQVLGVKLNAAAFRRKIEAQDLVERIDMPAPADAKPSRGRPPGYFRLRQPQMVDLGRVVMLPDRRRGG